MKQLTKQQRKKVADRIRNGLRELWSKSPYRSIALANAKSGSKYTCAKCKQLFYAGEIEVDHIVEMPRASYSDPHSVDWNKFIEALFVNPDPTKVQVLCKKCHARKTAMYSYQHEIGADIL